MSKDLVHLRAVREQTIEHLSACYANDVFEVDELERRIEQAERAMTVAELEELVADLAPLRSRALATAGETVPGTAIVRAEDAPQRKTLAAVFGGIDRKGSWVVPRELTVWSVFGGAEIDLREASLAPGENRIKLRAFFGGVTLIVPPGLRVDVEGTGILGGFDDETGEQPPLDPSRPHVAVSGIAIFGGVEVVERHVGESKRQARRRRRKRRRLERAAHKKRLKQAEKERKQLESKK